jgi:hypothetical protein
MRDDRKNSWIPAFCPRAASTLARRPSRVACGRADSRPSAVKTSELGSQSGWECAEGASMESQRDSSKSEGVGRSMAGGLEVLKSRVRVQHGGTTRE